MRINDLLNSGYSFSIDEKLIQRKFNYINVVLFIGLFGLFQGLFYNFFITKNYDLAYIEIAVLFLQSFNIYILRANKNSVKYVVFISSLLIITLFNILYSMSSPGDLKIIWIFIYAPALMVINQKKYSTLWLSILISTILFQSFQTIYPVDFTHAQTIYFLLVTIILSFLMYYIDALIKNDIQTIISQNNQLCSLNSNLEEKIEMEVKKNRIKDIRLDQQSKSANIGSMIANISHQWKQPLSIISASIGNLSLYKEGLIGENEFDDMKSNIEQNVKYLTQTIDDFKNLLNPNQSKSYHKLSSIIDSAKNLLATNMIKNDIIFTCDYKFDGNIEIYKNELIQVLLILLNNSIYQMSLNSNNKNILIAKTEVVESDIRLIITDNGGGIEDNIIKNIFDRYFTTKDEDQGTGLGLSIAYDIIKNKLNGTISAKNINFYAENENFKGACFEIVLRDYLND